MRDIQARSPGRICLLGDNADLLEKPAIAAAISAYLTVEIQPRSDDQITLYGQDIGFTESFRLGEEITLDSPLKYVKGVYRRFETQIPHGFDLAIHSEIPVSAGLSSSTALCIASIRGIARLCGQSLTPAEIAELSFQIERYDLDIECGRMDQYAIAFGGVTYIETGDRAGVEQLPLESLPVVVADTQEKHDTQALQKWIRERIAQQDPELMLPLLEVVKLVELGRKAILSQDLPQLGSIMNHQQVQEHAMGTSTDRLELFCRTARRAGAWGAKQMGAGGGGCMIALCPPEQTNQVSADLLALGAPTWSFDLIPPADSTGSDG
jgi:mevalonate kinase